MMVWIEGSEVTACLRMVADPDSCIGGTLKMYIRL